MSKLTVVNLRADGQCTTAHVDKRPPHVHATFGDFEIRSASHDPLTLTEADVHPFPFPPPLNTYILPKDAMVMRMDGRSIVPDDVVRAVAETEVRRKRALTSSAYERAAVDPDDVQEEDDLFDAADDEAVVDEDAEDDDFEEADEEVVVDDVEEEEEDDDDDDDWCEKRTRTRSTRGTT